jgi:hypothetical protein
MILAPSPPVAHVAAARPFNIRATVKMLTGQGGGGTLLQAGTFTGAPLGRGKVSVRTFVGQGRGSVVRFVLTTSRGVVRGTGDCAVSFRGTKILYKGTAKVTGGSGAYRGLHGGGLRVSGSGEISGDFTVLLTGRLR